MENFIQMTMDFIINTDPLYIGLPIAFILLLTVCLSGKKEVEAHYRDMIDTELPHEVRDQILAIREKHPECCRTCNGSATNPLFLDGVSEEEECPDCYAIGLDPYDTDKKLVKSGQYLVSTLYGVDPLYRGYSLPGGKLLALIEELEEEE